MLKVTTRNAASAIAAREPFSTSGALCGTTHNRGTLGWLVGEHRERFYADANALTYIVYSYATPIAWFVPDNGWYIPETRYSVTTTKHQANLHLVR